MSNTYKSDYKSDNKAQKALNKSYNRSKGSKSANNRPNRPYKANKSYKNKRHEGDSNPQPSQKASFYIKGYDNYNYNRYDIRQSYGPITTYFSPKERNKPN